MKSAKPLLAGDFNIDILKDSTFKENFTSVLNEYDLKTTVNEAIRMTSNTSTCFDNIIIPSALQYAFKILPSHYSDHTMQILEIFVSVPQPKGAEIVEFCLFVKAGLYETTVGTN
nr:unnamed protein product [Callosobruchus analis]